MYDALCRFLYRFCGIGEIKVRLQVVMRHLEWTNVNTLSIDNNRYLIYSLFTKMKYIVFCLLLLMAVIPIHSQQFMKMICKNNTHTENDIYFISRGDSTLNLRKPADNSYIPYMQIRLYISTNQNIDKVIMRSYSLKLNEINIEFNDSNYHLQTLQDQISFYRDYNYTKEFVLQINIDQLKNKISESYPLIDFKDILKKAKTAEYKCKISYEYNNEIIETEFIYNYEVKFTKIHWWDKLLYFVLYIIFGGKE